MTIDRIPIPTQPGLVSVYADRAAILPPTVGTVGRLHIFVTDAPSGGPLTVELADDVDPDGTRASVSIPDGEFSATAAMSIALDGAQTLYMNVTASNGFPMNLSGYIELASVDGVYTALTTLERVKRELGITDGTRDTILTDLIAGVSELFTQSTGRSIVETVITGEKIDGNAICDALRLAEYPVTTMSALYDSAGSEIDASSYDVDTDAGLIYGVGYSWTTGRRNYSADYTAGFASIPAQIVSAVTAQVCHEFAQTDPGGARRGLLSGSNDLGSYTVDTRAVLPVFANVVALFRDLG